MLAVNGHSSTVSGFAGGGPVDETGNRDEDELVLEPSSALDTRLSFFEERFLGRERRGKRDVFWVLAFRRAGSTAVGSSSACISWGKRAFEEDEAGVLAMTERIGK